jgi:FkbM family methyltransferase
MSNMHAIAASIGPGDLVFDVGAHVGDKALWFLARGATVVCVEPQPNVALRLRERLAGKPNVTILQKGLGRAKGMLNMSVCSSMPVISTFSDGWKHGRFANCVWDQTVAVEVVTLDDLIGVFGTPKYCKIDVEGFELEVLHGLSRKAGCLSFEFTSEFIQDAVLAMEHLIQLGYTGFNVSYGEAATFEHSEFVSRDQLVSLLLPAAKRDSDLWGDIYAR